MSRPDGALFHTRPLDALVKLEEDGKLHLESLQVEVFQPLQIHLGKWDANALHGHAVSHLHHLAQAGSEKCKSVCFGLVYALIAVDWCGDADIIFWQYLSLAQTLDDSGVLIRTLCELSHRVHTLQEACRSRFLLILEELIETKWENTHLVFEVLQRELRPGDRQAGTAGLLDIMLKLAIKHVEWLKTFHSTARLTFLWAMRWASALEQPSSPELQQASGRLRQETSKLTAMLWQEDGSAARQAILDAGPSFLWAVLHCRQDPAWIEVWKLSSTGDIGAHLLGKVAPEGCLEHVLSDSEFDHLGYILQEDGIQSEAKQLSPDVTYPREIPLPQGLPVGWKAVEKMYGPESKTPNRPYIRYHSENGRHKYVASAKQVIKLHCEEMGIPWEPEYAKYENAVQDTYKREARYCQWFAAKHLGNEVSVAHLADIVLWCLKEAEDIGRPRATLWAWLWNLAVGSHKKGRSQAVLAFLFAARNSGYARNALTSVLEGVSRDTRIQLQELADASLPPGVATSLRGFLAT